MGQHISCGGQIAKDKVKGGGDMKNKIWLFGLVILLSLIPIAVLAQNQPPVADAGADRTIYTAQTIALNGSAYDADGDAIVFWAWAVVQSPEGATWSLSAADTSSPLFVGFSPGDYVLSLFVGDSTGLFSNFDFTTVLVRDNLPPVEKKKRGRTLT
jgi:hypothetical protein